jgi:hypothetical protein
MISASRDLHGDNQLRIGRSSRCSALRAVKHREFSVNERATVGSSTLLR